MIAPRSNRFTSSFTVRFGRNWKPAASRNGSWRLPSSRALATDLGISRFTVKLAFSKLHAEGYLRSEVGSGTFAADPLPETLLRVGKPNGRPEVERPPRISERVRKIPDPRTGKQFDVGIDGGPGATLVPGVPAVDEFPIAVWERLRAEVLAQKGAHLLRYASSHGDADLRKAIAAGHAKQLSQGAGGGFGAQPPRDRQLGAGIDHLGD